MFARAIRAAGRLLGSVAGARTGVDGFVDEWTHAFGVTAQVSMEQGVYVLDRLRLPRNVIGEFRRARDDDAPLVNGWMRAFAQEVKGGEDEHGIDVPIGDGRVGLWTVQGRPVSVAYASRVLGGVARVSGVYTPPEVRGHGYARACVAEVSRRVVETGGRCMLYTDLSNPTSNAIYADVGYRKHSDVVVVEFVGAT